MGPATALNGSSPREPMAVDLRGYVMIPGLSVRWRMLWNAVLVPLEPGVILLLTFIMALAGGQKAEAAESSGGMRRLERLDSGSRRRGFA